MIDDVHFVDGRELIPWLRQLDGQGVTRESAGDILERLTRYRAAAFKSRQDAVAGR
jgi:hypothetical protein